MEHLFDGIMFGIGFGIAYLPFELILLHLTKKKPRVKKIPHLKLIKNVK